MICFLPFIEAMKMSRVGRVNSYSISFICITLSWSISIANPIGAWYRSAAVQPVVGMRCSGCGCARQADFHKKAQVPCFHPWIPVQSFALNNYFGHTGPSLYPNVMNGQFFVTKCSMPLRTTPSHTKSQPRAPPRLWSYYSTNFDRKLLQTHHLLSVSIFKYLDFLLRIFFDPARRLSEVYRAVHRSKTTTQGGK